LIASLQREKKKARKKKGGPAMPKFDVGKKKKGKKKRKNETLEEGGGKIRNKGMVSRFTNVFPSKEKKGKGKVTKGKRMLERL